jgi:hypothetical protein
MSTALTIYYIPLRQLIPTPYANQQISQGIVAVRFYDGFGHCCAGSIAVGMMAV